MVLPVWVPSMVQIELFNHLLRIILIIQNHTAVYKLLLLHRNIWWRELLMLDRNTGNHLTVCKQMSFNNSFKDKFTYKLFTYKSCIYKQDMRLNNPQGLLCHKTPTNLSTYVCVCFNLDAWPLDHHLMHIFLAEALQLFSLQCLYRFIYLKIFLGVLDPKVLFLMGIKA